MRSSRLTSPVTQSVLALLYGAPGSNASTAIDASVLQTCGRALSQASTGEEYMREAMQLSCVFLSAQLLHVRCAKHK